MKRILILIALAALATFAFSGCSGNADAAVKCDGGCGMEMAKTDAKEIEGKFYCGGCAGKMAHDDVEAAAETAAETVACAGGCGMELATATAKKVDGKFYCAGCVDHIGHNH